MRLNTLYRKADEKIGSVFAAYGRFAANHAVKVLIVAIIMNILLAAGIVRLKKLSSSDDIYFPTG